MQVIILQTNRDIYYYDPTEDDFTLQQVECQHEFMEAARQRKLYCKYRGSLSCEIVAFPEISEDSLLSEIF